MTQRKEKLLEALAIVAENNIEFLSYEGQQEWNELAEEFETTVKAIEIIKGNESLEIKERKIRKL